MRVFLVMATTGEYSDRDERPITAVTDESLAQQICLLCDARAREIRAHFWTAASELITETEYGYWKQEHHFMLDADEIAACERLPKHELDPDFNGRETRYFFYEAELDDPKVLAVFGRTPGSEDAC